MKEEISTEPSKLGGECLKLRTRVLGAENRDALVSMCNLAKYYFGKEDLIMSCAPRTKKR